MPCRTRLASAELRSGRRNPEISSVRSIGGGAGQENPRPLLVAGNRADARPLTEAAPRRIPWSCGNQPAHECLIDRRLEPRPRPCAWTFIIIIGNQPSASTCSQLDKNGHEGRGSRRRHSGSGSGEGLPPPGSTLSDHGASARYWRIGIDVNVIISDSSWRCLE